MQDSQNQVDEEQRVEGAGLPLHQQRLGPLRHVPHPRAARAWRRDTGPPEGKSVTVSASVCRSFYFGYRPPGARGPRTGASPDADSSSEDEPSLGCVRGGLKTEPLV